MGKMVVLLNPDTNEMVCVPKAETGGFEDWTVLEERLGPPPENCKLVKDKGWVKNEEPSLEVKINGMTLYQFYQFLQNEGKIK